MLVLYCFPLVVQKQINALIYIWFYESNNQEMQFPQKQNGPFFFHNRTHPRNENKQNGKGSGVHFFVPYAQLHDSERPVLHRFQHVFAPFRTRYFQILTRCYFVPTPSYWRAGGGGRGKEGEREMLAILGRLAIRFHLLFKSFLHSCCDRGSKWTNMVIFRTRLPTVCTQFIFLEMELSEFCFASSRKIHYYYAKTWFTFTIRRNVIQRDRLRLRYRIRWVWGWEREGMVHLRASEVTGLTQPFCLWCFMRCINLITF